MIEKLFPSLPESEWDSMLQRLLSTRKVKGGTGPCKTKVMHQVVKVLAGDEEENIFQDLKDEVETKWRHDFVIERMGHSKEAASALTPSPIKALRPPVAGCVLVWQVARFAFEAYWPLSAPPPEEKKVKKSKAAKRRKTHTSTSASYKAKRTQLQALVHCVKFLWKHHVKAGGETRLCWSQYLLLLIPHLPGEGG